MFLFYLTSLAIVTSLAADTCPETCLCRGDTLTCSPDTNEGVKLERIPTDLQKYNLLHIRNVYLEHNRLRALIRDGFNGLDGAITIKLSHNLIRYIDRFAFDGLYNIRKIDLSHNEIAFIEDAPFQTAHGLRSIHLIDLSFNQIKKVDDVMFLGLESLQELYLNHNLISKVGIAAFMPLRSLRMLYLAGNPIKCSCSWFEVWDVLQSRDIEIMDTSDAVNCNFKDATNCIGSLSLSRNVSQESPEIGTGTFEPDQEQVVTTKLTIDDLRPPDTDESGYIISGADSYPIRSPEGERVLSEYDVLMRQRIEAIHDQGKKRLYSLVFHERMRNFITALQGGKGSVSTVKATTTPGNELDTDYRDAVFDGYEKDTRNTVFDGYEKNAGKAVFDGYEKDTRIVTPTTNTFKIGEPFKIMIPQLERVLEQLFPPSLSNFSEVARVDLGEPKSPERSLLINRLVTGDIDALLQRESELAKKMLVNVSELINATTPESTTMATTENTNLTLMTKRPLTDALKQPQILIPAVIGLLVFVCFASLAISMFSGLCRAPNEKSGGCDPSKCCSCKWVATINEKLMVRKLHMERQSKKTTAAKSEFLKLHCQARKSIIRLSPSTSPSADPSLHQQPGTGVRGVVSITPLVLTDDFPKRSKTSPGNELDSETYSSSSSPDMNKDIKNCLSPDGKETTGAFTCRNHSPGDEVTLFEVPLSRSTSNPLKKRLEEPGLSVRHARDSTSPPCITSAVDAICHNKEPTSTPMRHAASMEKSSSELRWYARECLSSQRMMVRGRTPSMTSSDDVIGDADIKKEGENGN
ncbi:uncharacterized protein [Asterias amurensis]|uniref:uncharacterized protein isoform X1 n=1 Tax=Asterias amurensis TaxID=7602 RepID=UPI003AB69F05